MVYSFLIIYILCCGVLYLYPRYKRTAIILIVIALTAVMGLRGRTVGVDTGSYETLFNEIAHISFSDIIQEGYYKSLEPGWVVINKVINEIGGDYFAFQLIVSALICGILGYVFFKDSRNSYISIITSLPVVYLISFNIQRQMLACAVLFLAWHFLIRKKYITAVILSLIAYSFHLTSVLFIFVFVLYLIRNKKYFSVIAIASAVILLSSYLVFVDRLSELFPKYHNYYGNNKTIQTAGFAQVVWLIETILSIYILLRYKLFNATDKCVAAFSLICIVSFYIGLSFNYFERLGMDFAPYLSLMFPIVGQSFSAPLHKVYNFLISSCFLIWFYISTTTGQYIYNTWI